MALPNEEEDVLPVPGSSPEDYVAADTPEGTYDSPEAAPAAPAPPALSQSPGSAMSNLDRIADYGQSVKRFDARTALANQKKQEVQKKREHNAAARLDTEQTGAQYLSDAKGFAQPVVDASTGKRKFTPSTSPVRFNDKGKPYQVRISEDGTRTIEDPDQNADYGENPDDPNDPNIYRRTKATPWQPVDPEEGLKSSDGRLVAASARLLHKRELEKVASDRADIELKLSDPARPRPLAPKKREELSAQRDALAVETPKPGPQAGLFGIGVNQQATAEAQTAWMQQEQDRKTQLSRLEAEIASDDEHSSLSKKSYELALQHKALKDEGPAGYLARRRKQSAAGLAELPPDQAEAELQKRQAALQGADQEISTRATNLKDRSDALTAEQMRGVTAERSAEIERERAGLLSESQQIQDSLAKRNALADDTNAGLQARRAKQESEEKAHREEMRKDPALAPVAKELDAIDAEASQRSAVIQAMPAGPEKEAAVKVLSEEMDGRRQAQQATLKKVQYPRFAQQEHELRSYISSLADGDPEKPKAQAHLDEIEKSLGNDPDYQASRASEEKFQNAVKRVADIEDGARQFFQDIRWSREGRFLTDNTEEAKSWGIRKANAETDATASLDTPEQVARFHQAVTNLRIQKTFSENSNPKGFWDKIHEIRDNPAQLLPFIASAPELAAITDVGNAVKKIQAGTATNDDFVTAATFAAQNQAKKSMWYNVAGVLAMLPSFAGELVMTGGAYSLGKEAAVKGAVKGLESLSAKWAAKWVETMAVAKLGEQGAKELLGQLAVKSAASMAGSAAQLPLASFGRITGEYASRTMPQIQELVRNDKGALTFLTKDGEKPLQAGINSVANQYVEVFSEHSGAAFDILGKVVGKAIPAGLRNKIGKAFIFGKWMEKNPGAKPSQFGKLLKEAGWNGVFQEMGEERIGDLARGFTEFAQRLAGGEGFVDAVKKAYDDNAPDSEQLLTELISFSVPGAAISGANFSVGKVLGTENVNKPSAGPAIRPEQVAAVNVQIDAWQPPAGLTPEGAQTERLAASGAIKLISGRPVESLLAEERTALESKLPDKSPRMEEVGGIPVITRGQLSRLQQVAPITSGLAIRDEEALRQEILSRPKDAPAGQPGGTSQLSNENSQTPQQPWAPADQAGINPQAGGSNRAQASDSAGKGGVTAADKDLSVSRGTSAPPIPVGKFGPLITPKEKGASRQLQARLAGSGVDASTAKDFADYYVRREGTSGWGPEKVDSAIAEFDKAGGRTNPLAIRKAIFAGAKSQQAAVDEIHSKVVSDLGEQYQTLTAQQRDRLDKVVRYRLAPELITYAGAVKKIAANLSSKGGAGVGVSSGMTFNFNVSDLLGKQELSSLQDDTTVERTINEEIAHLSNITALSAIRSDRTGETGDMFDVALAEASDIFGDLPKEVQDHVRTIRGKELKESPGQLGMEFFRMLLQHDLMVEDGKFTTADGVILTEQALNPDFVERVRDVFRKLLSTFGELKSTLSQTLRKEGRPQEEIDTLLGRIDRARKDSADIFRSFQKSGDAARSAAYEAQYAGRTSTHAAPAGAQPAGGSPGRRGRRGNDAGPGAGASGRGSSPQGAGPAIPAGPPASGASPKVASRLATLEAEKEQRLAAEDRAKDRRNLAVQQRAKAGGSKEAILANVPEEAKALAGEVLSRVQIGSPSYVLGANRERLPASYIAAAPDTVQASHAGSDFHKNPLYGGENTRPYHSDETEQNKVLQIAKPGALDEDSIVTDAKSAADGPAQVVLAIFNDATGTLRVSLQTAGGNGREQGINLAPLEDQERLSGAWAARGAQFGLENMPDGWRGYRFLGVYDLRDETRNREYQQLVDKLNPNQGVVQDTAARADIDAALNIPVERLLDVPVSLSPDEARDVMVGLVRDSEKLGLDRNLVAGLVRNPSQAQFYIRRLLVAAAFRSKALGEFVNSTGKTSGHVTISNLVDSATATALQLRAKGQGAIADAIGRTLERVVEYARGGRKINLAIEQAAGQQEIGEDGPVIQAIADALVQKVEFFPLNKKGIRNVDPDSTSSGFDELMADIARGVGNFTGEADLLGEAATISDTINAAIAAHFRKAGQLQARGSRPFNRSSKIRELQRKRQSEGLSRWESEELTQLEKTSGQEFMDFFDKALSNNFQLESEFQRRGFSPAPAEQLQLMARRGPESPSRKAAEDVLAATDLPGTNVPADHPSRKKLERVVRGAWNGLSKEFRAAVEEDAANGYPWLPGFMASPGLTRYERVIEAHFAAQIARDPGAALAKYTELAKEDFGKESEGRYLNADLARDVYPLYRDNKDLRAGIDRATLAPAGYITSRLAWNYWLQHTDSADRGTVVFMAGGMASGKTTSVHKTFTEDHKRHTAIFMDTVLGNYGRAEQMVRQVEEAGLTPHFAFVFRPFQNSADAAIQRLRDIGRPIDMGSLGHAHYEAQKVFLKLYREFGDRFPFEVITNEGHLDDISRTKGVDALRARSYGQLEDESQRQKAESETGRAGGRIRAGEASQLRAGESRVEGEARGQAPEGPLRNLPEAEAKDRLTGIYKRAIQSADLPVWEKTAVVHGFIPPADQLQARRSRGDDLTGDPFAQAAPEIAAYESALQGEGITHPQARAAAAMADLGVSAPAATDLFGNPLTIPDPERIANQEPSNETKPRRAKTSPRRTQRAGAQEPAAGGVLGDLFSIVAGQRQAELDPGLAGQSGGGIPPVDGREGVDSGSGGGDAAGGRDGGVEGTLPDVAGSGPGGRRPGRGDAADTARGAKRAGSVPAVKQRPAKGTPERNFEFSRDAELSPRGMVSKLRANLEAIGIIKTLDTEGRLATQEEKEKLAKFSGWGALSQAFDDDKADKVENGEIETRRETAQNYRDRATGASYSDYYTNEAARQEEAAQKLENWKNQWGEAHAQIKSLLTEAEYRAAKRSTINAHYTSPEIIGGMWDMAQRLGFKGGNVLEPGAGIGHFFGLMPEAIADRSKMFGVELDSYTAKILKALYPEADIQNTGFQTADIADNSIDLAISNVPFSNVPVVDKALEAMGGPVENLHDYFFGKSLTKLKPGGIQIFITSAFTMDKGNPEIRKWLSERADLVAAYRLPNDAFAANAGTQVVTDIIVLRKKDGKHFPQAQDWSALGDAKTQKGEPIRINQYFAAHPQNILGLLDNDGSMFAGREDDKKEMTVHSDPNRPARIALQQAMADLPQGIIGADSTPSDARTHLAAVKMGNITFRDGKYYFQGQETPDPDLNDPKNAGRVVRFLDVRDALNHQYDLELSETATEAEIEGNRRELNAAYDRFNSQFSNFHDRKNKALFIDDPDYFRLMGAEIEANRDKGAAASILELAKRAASKREYVKADIFSKRVLEPRSEPKTAGTVEDAFGISLGWRGRVDTGFISELTGQSVEQIERALIEREIAVRDPETGQILSREQYLSGNVRKKLEVAKASGPDYARNVALLEPVQPKEVTIEEVRFKVGATWIPPQVYSRFLNSIGISNVRIAYLTGKEGGGADRWEVDDKKARYSGIVFKDFQTTAIGVAEIMDSLLNFRKITISGKDEKGNPYTDDAATAQARETAKKLNGKFVDWARSDKEVGPELAAIYNREVNSYAQRTYDGQFLSFPWANKDFDIYPDKKNTIWRAIQEGYGLMAHGVGGGKTIIGSAIALEMRRLGMARKPMIVVHNATLEGFAKELARMAPTARVLVGRKDELQGAKRREFLMRIAAGDWDAVVIAHSTFGMIEDDAQVEIDTMQNLVDEMMESLADAGYDSVADAKADRQKSPTVKNLVKQIERLEAAITKASNRKVDEGLLNFQQLGVDALIVDEVHQFKKMPFSTKLDAKGIDGSFSKRGYALLMRARHIQERMGGKNVFTMTGTPVTNTLGEIWNMVRLVAPNLLKDYNIEHFDQFVSKFAEVETVSEMGPTGDFKSVDRLSKVVNLPEWATFLRMAADVKLGDDLVVKNRPGIKGGKPELVAVARSAGVSSWVDFVRSVLDKFADLTGKDFAENPRLGAIPVQAFMASRAAAIDIRLIEPRAKDEPDSKVNVMLERLMGIYEKTTPYKGSQVIFADSFNQQKITLFDDLISTSNLDIELDPEKPPGTEFNLYEDIRAKLIARGVPESEIAVITDSKWGNDQRKQALFEMVNEGKVRIIIGSTQRLGTGVNMQKRMAAAHHLDVPWTPAELEQRDGRVFRQGNIHGEMGVDIELIRYGMKDTLDAALWQKLETKQRFITLALSGKIVGRELEEVDEIMTLAEQRAVLSGPYGQQLFELENRLRELNTARMGYEDEAFRRKQEIAASANHLRILEERNARLQPSIEKMRSLADAIKAADAVKIAVDGKTFDTKAETAKAIDAELDRNKNTLQLTSDDSRKETIPDVTSITVNGVPIYLKSNVAINTWHESNEDGSSEWKSDVKFSFDLLSGAGDKAEDISFGRVTSSGTLLARMEELGETVDSLKASLENNASRLRQISAMQAPGEWPLMPEYNDVSRRLQELRDRVAAERHTHAPATAPTQLQARSSKIEESPVDRAAARAYAEGVGASNVEEATNGISRTLQFTAPGRVGESGIYSQGDLFGGPETGGTGAAATAAGKAAAGALRPAKAGEKPKAGVASADLIAGLQGDWEALAREIDAKGRASSIFADLVNNRIPDWDVTGTKINSPEDVMALVQPIRSPYFESLKVMVLDGNNNVAYSQIIHVGSVNESIADTRRIYSSLARMREQTGKNYARIIISHNHPSGDPSPSTPDRRLQRNIDEVATATGWDVVDHVITNGETYFSFRDAGIGGTSTQGKEYTPRKDTGKPAPKHQAFVNAPWEATHRSGLALMDEPKYVAAAAKFLRNANPDSAHIFYLNTKMKLLAVERISMDDFRDTQKRNRAVLAGMAREGGYAFCVEIGGESPTPQDRSDAKNLREFASMASLNFIDFMVTDTSEAPGTMSHFSFRDAGLLEDPSAYGSRVNDEQTDFSFLPGDQPAAQADAVLDPLDRFKAELPQAMRIAAGYDNIPGVDQAEVRQTARLALADAARQFDGARGKSFSAYAGVAVRNRLRSLYRKEDLRRERFPVSLDEPVGADSAGIPATRGDFAPDTRTASAPDAAARDEAAGLLEEAISTLPQKMQVAVRGFNDRKTLEQIGEELGGVSKQRVNFLFQEAMRRMRGKLGERGVSSTSQLMARADEAGEESFDDIDALLRDLDSELPGYQAAAAAEEPGPFKLGRPDLAHGADNSDVRGADEYYTDNFSPESESKWQLEADALLSRDYAGTKRAIENAGLSGQAITPAQTKAAEKIATDLRNAMLKSGTPQARAAFNIFWISYRGTGTAAGRALASRRDPLKTPAERYRDFLADLILKPRPEAQKEIDDAKTPAEKTALIDAETKALLEKLKAAGINVDDILKDRVTLSLQNRNIIEEFVQLLARAAGDKESRQRAFRMILKNRAFADIAKATGLSESAVRQLKADFTAKMRAQHFAKFQAGAKSDSATLITGKQVDNATAEREFGKWLGVLGIVDDAKQGRPRFNIEDPAHVMRMARAIQAATRAGALDMAYEYWIMNILSGPQTQFVNIAGNTVNAAWDMTVQRGMEALVNTVVRDSKSARLGEFRHLVGGLLPGMSKGLAMGARAWSAEHDFFEHTTLGTPMEIDHFDKAGNVRSAIPGKLGRVVRVPGRALLFADSFFKTAIGQAQVGAEAYRMAKAEGLSGKKLAERIALLSQTREQVISGNIAKARPTAEMAGYFAKALANKDETLNSDDLLADRSSQAWEMAREQTAFDMARAAGWSDTAWQGAVAKSRELTFQQDLKEGKDGGNMVEDLAAKLQSMRGSNKLLGIFFPFVRTPYNIFRMGMRKTPLGSANLAWQVARGLYGLKDGKPYLLTHPEAVRDISEQLIAWTALALLFGAAQGDPDDDDKSVLITGSMPFNLVSRGARELQQRAYGGDYVIRIGGRNGLSINYGRYEPFATVLGTLIDTIRAIKSRGATADNMDALYGYLMAQAQSKTFLQGFSDISKAMEGGANVGEGTKRFIMQALVPNIIRQPLRNLDDYARDSKHADATYQALPAAGFAPPKTTIYGKDMQKTGNPVMRLFLSTPLKADEHLESADRLLLNWNRENPSQAYAPQAPADTYTKGGKEHKMTAEQYHRFSVAAGRFASVMLKGKLSASQIARPKIEDVETIRKVFEDARTMTRNRMFP